MNLSIFNNVNSISEIKNLDLIKFFLDNLNIQKLNIRSKDKFFNDLFEKKDFLKKFEEFFLNPSCPITLKKQMYSYKHTSITTLNLMFNDNINNSTSSDFLSIKFYINEYGVLKKIHFNTIKTIKVLNEEDQTIIKDIKIEFGNKFFNGVYSDLKFPNFKVFDTKILNKKDLESPKISMSYQKFDSSNYPSFKDSYNDLYEKIKNRKAINHSDMEFIQLTTDIKIPDCYWYFPSYFDANYFNEIFMLKDILKNINSELKKNSLLKIK